MEELAWTNGDKPERSKKEDNPALRKDDYARQSGQFRESSNKRDLANAKLNERQLLSQGGHNPFLMGTEYSQDLEVQESFLIPRSSNGELIESGK
jgi:hypothetical protein